MLAGFVMALWLAASPGAHERLHHDDGGGQHECLATALHAGAPLTLLVDGQTSTRFKALLPIRPNGSVGWIDPKQVKKFALEAWQNFRNIAIKKSKTFIWSTSITLLSPPLQVREF